jgi:hypothetical protein
MWTEDDRRQLAEYCREHDRLMAEVRDEEGRELIYKTTIRPPPAPEVTDAATHIDNEDLFDAVAEAFAMERERTRAEWEAAIANVKQEVAELRGKVSTLVDLLSGTGNVVNMPKGFLGRGRNVA